MFNKVKSIAEENIKTIENELNKLQINKRHSHIEQKALIDDLNEVVSLFLSKLDKDKKKAISISSDDEIRNKLDKLIKNIGSPPGSQEQLSNIFKEGEERFKNKIPPGYEDSSKKECFTYSGLAYEEKYGDLIVWKQIIDYAHKKSLKDIIFITSDSKPDWWRKVKNKTIGPRPELIDEIYREAGVKRFHIYHTERFLEYANKFLSAQVSESAIEEIEEVRQTNDALTFAAEVERIANAKALAVGMDYSDRLAGLGGAATAAAKAEREWEAITSAASKAAAFGGAGSAASEFDKIKALTAGMDYSDILAGLGGTAAAEVERISDVIKSLKGAAGETCASAASKAAAFGSVGSAASEFDKIKALTAGIDYSSGLADFGKLAAEANLGDAAKASVALRGISAETKGIDALIKISENEKWKTGK